MVALKNFPMISQRDGDPNADFDCVPASIAASMTWLLGKPYTARQIKDSVYGVAYTGGTAAKAYVAYCSGQGVKLSPVDGSGMALVVAIENAVSAQHPALITEPDPYSSVAGWSHVCAAYAFDQDTITVMDPWIDKPVQKTKAVWAAQLEFNQIWTLEKAMQIPTGWHDDGKTLTAPNGHKVVLGFRDHVLSSGWDANNLPLGEEFHADPLEFSNPNLGAGQKQIFTRTVLEYTQARGVFEAWQGQEIAKLLQLLEQAQTAPAAPPAQIPASVIDDLRALRTSNAANDAQLAKVLTELGIPV